MASFDDAFGVGGSTEPVAQTMTDQLGSAGAPMPPDYQPGLTVNPADVMTRMLRKGLSEDQARSIQKHQEPSADLESFGAPVAGDPHVPPPPPPEPEPEPVGGALSTGARAAGQEAVGIGGKALEGVGALASAVPAGVRSAVGKVAGGLIGGAGGAEIGGRMAEAAGPPDGQPATESPAYKAGKSIEDFGQKVFPVSEAERKAHPIASVVGSALGGVVPALALGAVDPAAAIAGGAALFGLSGAGATFNDAKAKGADDKTAREAAALSGVVGAAAGALDIGSILKPVQVVAPQAVGWAMRVLAQAAENGAVFVSVGEAQEFLGQQVAKMYDPKAGYDFDVNRLYGELIAGGVLGGIHGAFSGRGREETPPPPPVNDPSQRLPGPKPYTPESGNWAKNTDGKWQWEWWGGPDHKYYGEPPPGAPPRPDAGQTGQNDRGGRPSGGDQAGTGETGPTPGGEAQPEPPPRAGPEADTPDQTRRRGAMEESLRNGYGLDPSGMSFQEMRDAMRNRDILASYGFTRQEIQDLGDDHNPKFKAALKEAMEAGSQHPSSGEGSPGTRDNPVDASGIDAVKNAMDADPSAAQAQAENYKHIHAEIPELGLTGKSGISVETVKGGTRKGPVDPATGQPAWTSTMGAHYARIKGTKGADGQELDLFVGSTKDAPHVFILDQQDPKTGKFDEHKIFARFNSAPEAYQAYLASHDATGRARIGGMRALTPEEFKAWIASGKTTEPMSDSMKTAAKADTTVDNMKDMGGGMAAGMAEGMHARLWALVEKGETKELGKPQALLQAAKMVRDAGGLKTAGEFRAFAQEYGKIERGPGFQKEMRDLVSRWKPAAETGEPAAPHTQQAAGSAEEATGGAGDVASTAAGEKTAAKTESPPDSRHNETNISPVAPPTQAEVEEAHKTLAEAGVPRYPHDHVDIMRALQIKNRELYDFVDAFQIAVLRNRLDDGFITPEQVRAEQPAATAEAVLAEGEESPVVLEPVGASERGAQPEASGPGAGGEVAASESESGTARGSEAGEGEGGQGHEAVEGEGGLESHAAGGEPDTGHAEPDTGGTATTAEDGGRSESVATGGEPAAESHDETAVDTSAAGEHPIEHAGERNDAGTAEDAGDLTEAHERHREKFGRKNIDVMEAELVAMEDQIALHEKYAKRDSPSWNSEDDPQWQVYIQDIAQMRDDIDEALVAVGKPAKYAAEDAAAEEAAKAAEEKPTETAAETTKPGKTKKTKEKAEWTEIGKNADGKVLFEDKNGVRSYVEAGIRTTEAVAMRPTRGGMEVVVPEHTGEWALAEKQDRTKMQDVGEVLAGARKDRMSGITSYDDIKHLPGNEQAGMVTKEGVWPRPDYSAMVEKGLDPQVAYMVKTIYDRIPTKPDKNNSDNPDGRRNYIDGMNTARDVLEGVKTIEDLRVADDKVRMLLRDKGLDRDAFDALRPQHGPHRWRNPFGFGSDDLLKAEREVKQGWPNKEPWKTYFRVQSRTHYPTTQEREDYKLQYELAQADFKDAGISLNKTYGQNSWNPDEISLAKWGSQGKEPIDPNTLTHDLRETWDNLAEANRLAHRGDSGKFTVQKRKDSGFVGEADSREAAEELAEQAYQKMRAESSGEKLPDRPHLDKLERIGPDIRAGRKLTETDFMNEFGFRGVQFGDWVRSDEGRKIVDHAFDALHDLARVLEVDPKMMSLDGTLGMAFGARGGGKFAAHYEPDQLIINITKLRGAGSLAHEWGHALDRFLGELDRQDAYKGGYRMQSGSEGGHKKRSYYPTPAVYEPNTHNENKRLRPDVQFAFETLMERLHTRTKTRGEHVADLALKYKIRSDKLAAVKASPSWAKANKKWIPQEEKYLLSLRQQLTRVSRGETFYPQSRPSDFLNEAKKISKSGDYWVRPTELFARSFESYVFDKLQAADQKSQFLVQGVEPDRYAMGYRGNPYPYARDREDIDYDYDRLFRALGRYTLKSKAERATIPWVKDPFTEEDLAPLARDEETVEPWWPDVPEKEESNEHTGTGESGEEALGEVASGEGEGTEVGGQAAGGDTRSGEPGADADRPSGDAEGVPGTRSKGGSPETVHPPETGDDGGDAPAGTGRSPEGGDAVSETPASVTAEETKPQSETPPPPPVTEGQEANIPGINYRITDETALGHGSEDVKFKDNLAAVNVLKDMEREGRRATPAEQRVLARYVGWGGLSNAFSEPPKAGWEKRAGEVATALTPEEFRQARRSTPNAHYTSKTVIDAMWNAVKRFGFKGGLSLELSSGTGNFIGLVPEGLKTKFIAVEYDSLTARIAQALYPQETVLHSGLQYVPLPDGEAVLNIGNPPFGKGGLRFQHKPELNGMSIHNQFFLAGLDALRPGGLQALVVSHHLMDAVNTQAREKLAIKGKLLGMIRLPDTAFQENAKTEVVTDIVFLQRNTPAEEKAIQQAIDASHEAPAKNRPEESARQTLIKTIPNWVGTDKIRDPLGGEPMVVNRYFAENPHMILGRLERSGTMYGGEQLNVKLDKGADLADMLRRAVGTLPRDVLNLDNEVMEATLARHRGMSESLKIALAGHEVGHVEYGEDGKLRQIFEQETPNGGYEVKRRPITAETPWSRQLMLDAAGRWYTLAAQTDEKGVKQKQGKRNVYARKYFPDNKVPASMQLGDTKFDRLKDMVTLRDLTKKQLTLEADDAPTKEMEANRKKLAAAYKGFIEKNGLLNEARNSQLASDLPDGALIMALETSYRAPITNIKAARTGEKARKASATPAPIMSRRVVPKYEPATSAATPTDALSITLSERGRVDMPRIAALLGMTEETAAEKLSEGDKPLVFKDPESGNWETANDYLSGQVARKLEAAKVAGIHENVKALEAVQPEKWGADNITPMMGANWIPAQTYADFASHLVGGTQKVNYGKLTNSFAHESRDPEPAKLTLWKTDRKSFEDIFSGMLNSNLPKVFDEDADGNKHLNVEATTLVGLKAKEIENEFLDWIFKESERRNKLVDLYNDKFNTRVNRQHDGSHLTLPGKVPDAIIRLRRSQLNGVWRGINERNVLYDHVVGAGKTFTAIARAMERRRMGLSHKPMIVVPNHLVDQWTQDVYKLYPGAKVLAAGNNQFTKQNRRRLFAKIATGDYDIVIVPHSSFGYIGISPDTEGRFLEAQMRVAVEAVKEAEQAAAESGIGGFRKPYTVKQAEQLVAKLQGRMDALRSGTRDRMLTFEQMGIDDMTIDEAHEFKNLFYHTRMTGVRGMGDQGGSKKAFDLYNKVQVLNESPTGSVVFMTGTPISNSAVEMYTMMRYLAAEPLKELGLEHFDAWRTQSVSATPKWEPTESGGLKEVTRLGRSWSNMRALMELYRTFADSVTQEDLDKAYAEDNNGARFPVPQVRTGGRKEVVVKPTEAQLGLLEGIVDGFNELPFISDPQERNAERLRLMDRARKVSLDARSVDPKIKSVEKGGKLETIANNVARIWKATDKDAGTQLVFLDRGVKSAKGDNKIIKDYDELVAKRDALAPDQEEQYRDLTERLDKFDPNEIEELRRAQVGGWNAYDQLKQNLIARGIPADEIRFVQEANNDAEKKALFDTVNDGKTRVLIGSTQRMGAGTNVQERLVALHHADVTWKPSDIEQREGRIVRQGNKLLEKYGDKFFVDIMAYVTERTVDAKMWDLNSTKLKMINGIRKYDGAFNMDFADEDAVGMAEIAALASGDPLLLERVKSMAEIDNLELLERAHRRKMFGIEDQIEQAERAKRDYPAMIKDVEDKAADMKAEKAKVADSFAKRSVTIEGKKYVTRQDAETAANTAYEAQKKGDELAKAHLTIDGDILSTKALIEEAIHNAMGDVNPFEAKIGKETITRRVQMAREIKNKVGPIIDRMPKGSSTTADIGKMLGSDLTAGVARSGGAGANFEVTLALTRGGRTIAAHTSHLSAEKGKQDLEYSIQAARALFDRLENDTVSIASENGDYMRKRIATADEMLPVLREQKGKPFEQEMVLQAKRARLEEIVRELAARTHHNAARAAPAEKPKEEPAGISSLDELDALGMIGNIENHRPGTEAYTSNVVPERMMASLRSLSTVPAAVARRQALEAGLTQLIERLVGKAVKVQFEDTIPIKSEELEGWGYIAKGATTAGGVFMPQSRIIKLAMADPKRSTDIRGTAFHEAVHALEFLLANEKELDLMKRETPRLRKIVQKAFGLSDEHLASIHDEEIRAMAGDAYLSSRADGPGQSPYGIHVGLRGLFERMRTFLRKIKDFMLGRGYKSFDDLMDDFYEGKIADREGRAMPQWPTQGAPKANLMNTVRTRAHEAMGSSTMTKLVEGFQDLSVRVKHLQDQVEARSMGVLPDSKAFYTMKRLFPGKVATRVEDFNKRHLDPLVKVLKDNRISLTEIGDYLYASHAVERNAAMEAINPGMDSGSGMSDTEAAGIIRRVLADPRAAAFEQARQMAKIMRADTLQNLVNDELMTQAQADAWAAKYDDYVPLRGFEVDDGENDDFREPGKHSVRGPESKQALGRRSKADNPLVNLIDQAYRGVQRGEKNRYLRSLYSALAGIPREQREDIARLNKGGDKREINPATGLVHTVEDWSDRNKPEAVHLKIRGQSHYIVFKDRVLAEAVKAMHAEGLGMFEPLLRLENKIKALWTHYSPDFLARHFLARYPIEGTLNAFEEAGLSGIGKYIKDAVPFMGKASRAIFASNKGEVSTDPEIRQMQVYWDRMRKQGGAMGFRQMRDVSLMKEHLETQLRTLNGRPDLTVRDKWRKAIEGMDIVTNALDNSLRLAAFHAVKVNGGSDQAAALAAREATVDFQLKGKWANAVALWFPFANVAIQTAARMVKAVARSRTMRRVFMGTMLAGFLVSAFNYLIAGNDTDGTPFFEKIPEWDRRMNFIIMTPFKDSKGRPEPIKIPMPYNWALPLSMGYGFGGVVFGKLKIGQATSQMLHSALESLTPIGGGDNMQDLLAPELLRPLNEMATNRDAFNRPIHVEPDRQHGPDSYSGRPDFQGRVRTGQGWKSFAESVNDLSGGNSHKSGKLDFYPEDYRQMFDYLYGSQKRFGEEVVDTGKSIAKGELPAPTRVPVGRVFFGTDYDAANRAKAFERDQAKKKPWLGM